MPHGLWGVKQIEKESEWKAKAAWKKLFLSCRKETALFRDFQAKVTRALNRERKRVNYLEGLLHRLERYPTSCSKAAFEAFFW
jgi:hypothetical protein